MKYLQRLWLAQVLKVCSICTLVIWGFLFHEILGQSNEALLNKRKSVFYCDSGRLIDQIICVSKEFRVPLGVEITYDDAQAQCASLRIANASVNDVIAKCLAGKPTCSFQLIQGVIHVYSRPIVSDPKNFLNIEIPVYAVTKTSLLDASARLRIAINAALHPERYKSGAGGGYGWGYPPPAGFDIQDISVNLRDATVREILDELIVANGNATWVAEIIPQVMMSGEDFYSQTGYQYPERTPNINFRWDLVAINEK